ncbi:hypothetical protein PoB_000335800 [Plakobranchus ocellatus]|uniref:Uncharacterized protein n=1 Tax=Plakobranchus ocellatus TaxID=259542 RepID=A0AAV3Y3R9_9GAST|nr:hypothetical protein PoB_000335800 [Plakobranchus ocellatus]
MAAAASQYGPGSSDPCCIGPTKKLAVAFLRPGRSIWAAKDGLDVPVLTRSGGGRGKGIQMHVKDFDDDDDDDNDDDHHDDDDHNSLTKIAMQAYAAEKRDADDN